MFMGALIYVVPQQFDFVPLTVFRPALDLWGFLFLLGGLGMFWVELRPPHQGITLVVRCYAAALMLILAGSFISIRAWSGGIHYSTLGLALLLSPLLGRNAREDSPDLFGPAIGLSALFNGLFILLRPDQFSNPIFANIMHLLPYFGVGYAAGGALLLRIITLRDASPGLRWFAHGVLGIVFLGGALLLALPLKVWASVFIHGGIGLVLIALPALQRFVRGMNFRSLRAQLAVSLMILAAFPMILQAITLTQDAERAAIAEILASQEEIALTMARQIAAYQVVASDEPLAARLKTISEMLRLQAGNTLTYVVDERGQVIACPDMARLPSTDRSQQPVVAHFMKDPLPSGKMTYGEHEATRLAAFARVPDLNWAVVVERPESPVMDSVRATRNTAFGTMLLFTVTIFAGGIIIANVLIRPLQTLGRVIETYDPSQTDPKLERSLIEELNRPLEAFRRLWRSERALTQERQRVERERDLVMRQLEQAVRLRDEFLSIAAHELRTPTTALIGYMDILLGPLRRGELPEPARLERVTQMIEQQGAKLTNLINQLLDTSRFDGGKLTLEREQADVRQIVADVAMRAQTLTQTHTISLSGEASAPARVDVMRVEQVFTNLIDNALKYSPNGGPIDIDVRREAVGARDEVVRVSITDQGVGIPPEWRGRIFDRFFRAHESKHFGGFGLGLYISQQIVTLHGGKLWAEFPDEGGTRFVLTLPAAPPEAKA